MTTLLAKLKEHLADQMGACVDDVSVQAETHWPFSAQNVRAFVTFLRSCGGFEIH